MKIKCINNKWNNKKLSLTIGKSYDVTNKTEYWYQIIDDDGIRGYYPKERFKLLSELRNETIDKLLE